MQRNLLNKDEILRIPSTKLLVILRGNNPLLLDKMIYKEHHLAEKLKDSPIAEYNPVWIKNLHKKIQLNEKKTEVIHEKTDKIDWNNF